MDQSSAPVTRSQLMTLVSLTHVAISLQKMFFRQRQTGMCEQVTAFFRSGCLQQRACEGQQQGIHPNLQDGFGGRLQQTLYNQ